LVLGRRGALGGRAGNAGKSARAPAVRAIHPQKALPSAEALAAGKTPRQKVDAMSDTARLFNLDVVRVTADELIDRLTMPSAEVTARSKIISYLNAHTVNLAGRDSGFRKLLQGFDLLYADGMSVVRASRKLGDPLPER